MTWSTTADIRAKVQRRWDDGSLLRSYAAGVQFPVIDIALRGPKASEIGERLGEVRKWITDLSAGSRNDSRYLLTFAAVGGRLIGRNELPSRAIISSYKQAWGLIGTAGDVTYLDQAIEETAAEPDVQNWIRLNPLKAIALHNEWGRLAAAFRWLDDHRGSGRYVREITAPGIDTKFVERHRAVLGQLLGTPSSSTGFLADLGLAAKPAFTRLRPAPTLGLIAPISELALRHEELQELDITVRRAVIVENEITYLSVPVPSDGVVLWGKGFDVDQAGGLPWLQNAEIAYWGDLDTHGFAILDRLRAWLPQTRAFLMDHETLLAHRERWGSETSPTSARLSRLTPTEAQLYQDLVEDRLGTRIRLEQERIDWSWARDRFPFV